METVEPRHLDIFQIYARYCGSISGNDQSTSRELLSMLASSFESQEHTRDIMFTELSKLMLHLNLSVDSRQFNCFYDFVFFICRQNGQKNITVNRAIAAWRLVLAGRFRLLNQWCSFVEDHQRHNISADTWQQLLAFSRCINEDLDGYDPKGAWPVLIDDFVDHMYRTNQYNSCSTKDFFCSCSAMHTELGISSTFSGLNLLPGSKRKSIMDRNVCHDEAVESLINKTNSVYLRRKRLKQIFVPNISGCLDLNSAKGLFGATNKYKHGSLGCLQT